MPTTTASLPLPIAPPDVLAFAEKQGVSAYLPGVLAMTRRIFPAAPLNTFLEDDPEIANDRHIILEVRAPADSGLDELVAVHQQWSSAIFQHCPATHVCVFRLGVTLTA